VTKQISELPATPGLVTTDLIATKQGTTDYRATIDQLGTLIRSGITAADIMAMVQTLDTNSSGLNANFLQGNSSDYFVNASNLASGTTPNARLPNGTFTSSVLTTSSKNYIQFPTFIFGLNRIMIQFGVTDYYTESRDIVTTFPVAFASGLTNANEPILIVTPQCKRDGWSGATGNSTPYFNVELDVRPWYVSLSQFKASTIRTSRSGSDTVRANWIAIGKY